MSKLLPCPFCGGTASDTGRVTYSRPMEDVRWDNGDPVTEAYFVNCIKCGVTSPRSFSGGSRTKADAVAAWNRRA